MKNRTCCVVDVFLTTYEENGDTLIFDPTNRVYQHFIKDPETYDALVVKQNTYSMKNLAFVMEKMLERTMDEDTFHLFGNLERLQNVFRERTLFWCSVSLQETFGSQNSDEETTQLKHKKICFYFIEKRNSL